MAWQFNDGGRAAAGFKKNDVEDCVARSIAIATGKSYAEVHSDLMVRMTDYHNSSSSTAAGNTLSLTPCDGMDFEVYDGYLESLGWEFIHPERDQILEQLPYGDIIVRLTGHLVAVKDRVLQDTFDCREDNLLLWGYFQKQKNRHIMRCYDLAKASLSDEAHLNTTDRTDRLARHILETIDLFKKYEQDDESDWHGCFVPDH